MKKKILFVITKSNWGGAQRYVYDLAISLPKDQFDIAVAFGGTGLPGARAGVLERMLREAGVRTLLIKSFARDIFFMHDVKVVAELVALFRKERPDIVHLNSSKAGGLGALAARLAGIRTIVFTVHGWPFWEKRNAVFRILIGLLSWLTGLLSHRVIVISEHDRKTARFMPFLRNRIIRISNGIGPIDFLPATPSPGTLRVLTVGELNRNKNLFVGIDAVLLARSKGAPIVYDIVGEGELRDALESYITEKNAATAVHMRGFVPDCRRQYKAYDIFFLPSKKEGVPYVLLEAGLAGIPVIASNVGGIPEIIPQNMERALKNPNDVEGFAEALVELSQNAEQRELWGGRLKERVEQEFSLARMVRETAQVYTHAP